MNARMCRGYLGVFGPQIDALARKYTTALIELRHERDPNLKHGEYHITIASKPELQSLKATGTLPQDDSKIFPGLDQLNEDLQRANLSPVAYGLGSNQQGVYWVTFVWASGQKFRSHLGLPSKHFHITLTSVDEHGIDKGPSTVVWTEESLPFLRQMFYWEDREAVQKLNDDPHSTLASNKAEYLGLLVYGFVAQADLLLAQSAAELLVMCAPLASRSFICLGDVSIQRELWKLAMLSFGCALGIHSSNITDTMSEKFNRISGYCLRQLRRSAEHTEWGNVFVEGELDTLPSIPAVQTLLCRPWSAALRFQLQTAYAKTESSRWPSRSLESRVRVSTLQSSSEEAVCDIPVSDPTKAASSDIYRLAQHVGNLVVDERALITCPNLRPDIETSDHSTRLTAHPLTQYTLPRFFRWLVPFYVALMSTPRTAEDIAILASSHIGIRHIVTLTEETPLPDQWFRQHNIDSVRHTHIPIPNYKPPSLEQMDIILRRIYEPGGSPVLIHCGGGKGRAGTVAACYLSAFGFEPIPNQALADNNTTPTMSANEAIAALRLIRPGSIETIEQESFVKNWVSILWKRRSLLLPRIAEPPPASLFTDGTVTPNTDLLLLCGLPGSGKSWLSQAIMRRGGLIGKSHESLRNLVPIWRIVSQDESGSRATCENEIGRSVLSGSRVILDRCNPTSDERRGWIKLALWAQHPVCVWFDYDPQLCIDRAQDRVGHPTLLPGPRVRTAVASMRRSFQPPLGSWKSEGFEGLARITSFEAAVQLCQLLCPVELVKFPRTTHLFDLGAVASDDIVAGSSVPTPTRGDEKVVITEKVDGANLGFSLSSSRDLLVQNRSHYIHSGEHTQFKALDPWISDHRESLYAVLDRDNSFAERYILYGEWMAATHSIPYTVLGDLFYAFDLFDRVTGTFASRAVLERILANTTIQLTPVLCVCKTIPHDGMLSEMVRQTSRFYAGPMEGIYVKVENDQVVKQRSKVVRGDFIAGNDHWSKGIIRWNVLRSSA